MKKAKLFLTGLTVLTIVGGALAFNAKLPLTVYKCENPVLGGKCTIPTSTYFNAITTTTGGTVVEGDILNKNCVLSAGVFTCTTRTTFKAE